LLVGCGLPLVQTGRGLFKDFLETFFLIFFKGPYMLQASLEGVCVYNTPIFCTLPLHLGVSNLPVLMELGDFIFFEFFFPKIRVHLDLHIHRWNSSFMKK
jgi:hypothetical protein